MTLVIAEAGVNHNGQKKLAFDLVDVAKSAGADVVKFQTFKAKNLATETTNQADYQIKNTQKSESQLTMLGRLELPYKVHHELVEYCNKLDIEFLSTAFDFESLSFLVHDLGLKRLKIPSGELTNAPFVLAHAQTGCDLIISTGMATLAEIESALGVVAYGYLNQSLVKPSKLEFQQAYSSASGQKMLQEKVTLLHCTTEYPAPLNEINLKVMDTLSSSFNLAVGYSDHSAGITVPIAAAARGAVLIEKHFTLNKLMEGPDHKASLEPGELKAMVKAIREVELALGRMVKTPTISEIKNKPVIRKSLVAATNIEIGTTFNEVNLTIKRPGTGVCPYQYWQYLGSKAKRAYKAGEIISE